MHCLSIVFNAGSPVMWKLLYREVGEASIQANKLCETREKWAGSLPAPLVEITDDFGQLVQISCDSFAGCMLEDLDQSKLAHIEMSLHEAKTRAMATKQAQSDPALRTAGMISGGMPILSPMGPNGRM